MPRLRFLQTNLYSMDLYREPGASCATSRAPVLAYACPRYDAHPLPPVLIYKSTQVGLERGDGVRQGITQAPPRGRTGPEHSDLRAFALLHRLG